MKNYEFLRPVLCAVMLSFISCNGTFNEAPKPLSMAKLLTGPWLFTLDIGEEGIPFNASLEEDGKGARLVIRNGNELIEVTDVAFTTDSIYITLPVFDSRLCGKMVNEGMIEGHWYDYSRGGGYRIPFRGRSGQWPRFDLDASDSASGFGGKWEVTFSPDDKSKCKAIGLFTQKGSAIEGTFLTVTGDYRYLEGMVSGDHLYLSCFDGAHAFLFKAERDPAGMLRGKFWSGKHWDEPWIAKRNDAFSLPHPDSITSVEEGSELPLPAFIDLNGNYFSLRDSSLSGHVCIVQIMGTWCPNCADECRLFSEIYERYNSDGLEVVAVDYEKTGDLKVAGNRIEKFRRHTGANYKFLFAGKASLEKASADFSVLNAVTSFPTTIFIDRKGVIRKIHTGFYGPGTKAYYEAYKKEIVEFTKTLLNEGLNS